jgi:hypothetical protein
VAIKDAQVTAAQEGESPPAKTINKSFREHLLEILKKASNPRELVFSDKGRK